MPIQPKVLAAWSKLSQLPVDAWFRRVGPDAIVGRQRPWKRITAYYLPLAAAVDPFDGRPIPAEVAAVEIDGEYSTLADMLGRWEWTKTPWADAPQVSPCGL